MSQNMQGEAGIVLVKAPWGCGAQNQLRMSMDIVLSNMLGCVKKSWREGKSLIALRKKTLGTRFPGKTVGPRLALIDQTLEGALWYLKDGVMTVGCCLCVKWKHKWNSSGHARFSLVVTLDRNAFLTRLACVNTMLTISFQSLFLCFHFWHNFRYKF